MKQNQYELTYLIDPRMNEDDRTSLNSAIDQHVSESSGTILHNSPALRKKLAYQVNHQDSAFMRIMNIELPTEKVLEFTNFLKKSQGILRTTLLATPKRTRITPEILEKHGKKKGKDGFVKHDKNKEAQKAPKKEVTMQAVEKGIEEALTEEVV
ncbi:MAG TPA: 30S ribosomal protein S6 [Candidatus Andersenbacteria bacterium]|nr:30S ribosomal protein S6 [Candidatus Andersenbacteria bacterium]